MHGIVSLLSSKYTEQVNTLWDELENRFDIRGVRVTPFPHFSWQIAESYQIDWIEATLHTIAERTQPFTVRTTGLGIFSGEHPVIYIPLIKTAELVAYHRLVWEALEENSEVLSPYYDPEHWVPHITLAFMDVTPQNVGPILQWLSFQTYNWEWQVDHLAFLHQEPGGVAKLQYQVSFPVNQKTG